MSKVKIVSDPYLRRTKFFAWDGVWVEVTEDNYPNSALLNKNYTEGFFPFKASEIVSIIVDEFSDGDNAMTIVFEGPDDEWSELKDVCSLDNLAGAVTIDRSGRALANARDILPLIRDVFDELYPILAVQADYNQEAQDQLRKFRDASSNVVPIVVVGNYSAGKSSFINSLIGMEILPSGDRPVTARIFQIEKSDQEDRASIKFRYADDLIHILFTPEGTKVIPPEANGALIDAICSAVDKVSNKSIPERVRVALGAINLYREEPSEHLLSDLIEVKVPFNKDTEWDLGKRIVVFDTPGSNSNTNIDHARVLADAMRGMSDGLPIFVTSYDSLDSDDNAELCDKIGTMPALDERFAMIVVNKADDADLPEGGFSRDEEEWVLDTAISRHLFAQGIYFVSSIAGLGAKTNGEFSERHYDRVFRRLRDSFGDPDDKYYMRLFDYDLLPAQLRAKLTREAEECDNRILANSGLFSVERGIDEFADKYSAYNKCLQSEMLLRGLIEQTDDILSEKAIALGISLDLLKGDHTASLNDLIKELNDRSSSLREEAISGYLPNMNEWAKETIEKSSISVETLKEWEAEITADKQREMGADEKRREAKERRAAVQANLRSRMQNVLDTKDILGLAAVMRGYLSDSEAANEAEEQSDNIFRHADWSASNELFELVGQHFDETIARISREVVDHSKSYWESCAVNCRQKLLDFIASGSSIDEERKQKLAQTVINFRNLDLESSETEIMEIRYPFDPNKLWKAPLRIQYNMELTQRISKWRASIEPAHESRFRDWLNSLTAELEENADDLNPGLREKLSAVTKTERELEEQKLKRERLSRGEKRVSSYMKWQEG